MSGARTKELKPVTASKASSSGRRPCPDPQVGLGDAPAGDGQQRLGGVEPGDAGFPAGRQLEEGAEPQPTSGTARPGPIPAREGSSNLAASASSSSAQAAARAPDAPLAGGLGVHRAVHVRLLR